MVEISSKRRMFDGAGIIRGPVTWYCYLLLAFFVFMLTMQGNIVPFLKQELNLSYRETGLHASAIAAGAIIVGLLGDRVVRRYGRRRMLMLGALTCAGGAVMLCAAPAAWASIAACALMGLGASFIPTVAFAVLANVHGERRSVAINESSAINYGLAVLAPLLTSLCISMSLGWRSAVLVGAALGAGVVMLFRRVNLPEPAQLATAAADMVLPGLLVAQLAVTLAGFVIYWSFSQPLLAIGGLFVLGLGVSLLFPLTVGLAIGAAGAASDAASARATIAFGIALLVMPVLLGSLADRIGLRSAHWLVPMLIGGALFALLIARALQRQPARA